MPVKVYKPTTPSRRGMSVLTFEEITAKKPERSLLVSLKKHSGRTATEESPFVTRAAESEESTD